MKDKWFRKLLGLDITEEKLEYLSRILLESYNAKIYSLNERINHLEKGYELVLSRTRNFQKELRGEIHYYQPKKKKKK